MMCSFAIFWIKIWFILSIRDDLLLQISHFCLFRFQRQKNIRELFFYLIGLAPNASFVYYISSSWQWRECHFLIAGHITWYQLRNSDDRNFALNAWLGTIIFFRFFFREEKWCHSNYFHENIRNNSVGIVQFILREKKMSRIFHG